MDIYSICRDMVDKLSYAGTPERRLLFNMPSEAQFRQYETYQMRKQPGVELKIERRNKVTDEDRMMLADFKQHLPGEPQTRVYGAGEDVEEIHALFYLHGAEPNISEDQLMAYTPRGIQSRLYGTQGYYRRFPDELFTVPYPMSNGMTPEQLQEEARQRQEQQRRLRDRADQAQADADRARKHAESLEARSAEQQRLIAEQREEDEDDPPEVDEPDQSTLKPVGRFSEIFPDRSSKLKVIHLPTERRESPPKRQQLVNSTSAMDWSLHNNASNNNSRTAYSEPVTNPFDLDPMDTI
jgi:hypothetical protein